LSSKFNSNIHEEERVPCICPEFSALKLVDTPLYQEEELPEEARSRRRIKIQTKSNRVFHKKYHNHRIKLTRNEKLINKFSKKKAAN
jgi:hypothetical protein